MLMTKKLSSRWPILVFATLCIGVFSGFGGMSLALFLHFLQHFAYDQTITPIIQTHYFLYDVSVASPLTRVIVLLICGCVAGFGWWAVFRYGQPLVSISEAIKAAQPFMPIGTTLAHVFLQIITVALGSPLGREVAPRELAAVFACWLNQQLKLTTQESQILVACAAGAGLAAVYNVPFGGAMFTLEVLLGSFHWLLILPALTTSAIAVVVSWIGLGNESFYHLPPLSFSFSILIWAICTGPIFGFSAYCFRQAMRRAKDKAPKNNRIIVTCLLNFSFIGFLAIYFPAVLGNGRSAAQLGFDATALGLSVAAVLLVLRVCIVYSSLLAGAKGGLLTPSLAVGALMGVLLGLVWDFAWGNSNGIPMATYAVIGSTAFLAVSQKMPITAIVLIMEFTGINVSFFMPILLAVIGAMGACSLCVFKSN